FVASGFQWSDNASILTGALAREPGENVGPYAINVGTLSAGSNYTIDYTGDYLTITAASLSVEANSQTKVYGSGDPALTFVASGFQWSDNASILTGALAREPGENVGPYAINLGTLSAGSNYTINYMGDCLTITAALLTITPHDQFKRAGWEFSAGPSTAFSAVGLKNNETVGSVMLSSPGAPASALAGVYPLDVVSTAGGTFDPANYVQVFVSGQLFVGYVSGEFTYDWFTRPQDQWRTLHYLLGGNAGDVHYGSKPKSGEENLVELSSHDLFGSGSE
ncbi:MAG: MBG domain-containing protein, partial [Thermoguttaceae bacterium]|nr:MBG domain-containing protein [Thermoguttaceae bacterium]